jgi:cytidine deaminase
MVQALHASCDHCRYTAKTNRRRTRGTSEVMDPEQLMQHALQARRHAYAPYSNFAVGAAVETRDGRIFHGCNVENASYGLCNCAERTALFNAVAAGCRPGDIMHVAVVGDTEKPVSPCGACRQVMAELIAADVPVWLGNLDGARHRTTVGDLIPDAFHLLEPPRSTNTKTTAQ